MEGRANHFLSMSFFIKSKYPLVHPFKQTQRKKRMNLIFFSVQPMLVLLTMMGRWALSWAVRGRGHSVVSCGRKGLPVKGIGTWPSRPRLTLARSP